MVRLSTRRKPGSVPFPGVERLVALYDLLWKKGPLHTKEIAAESGRNVTYVRPMLATMEDMGWIDSHTGPDKSELAYNIKYRAITPQELLASPWVNWHPPTD